jgi:hypothetical protein
MNPEDPESFVTCSESEHLSPNPEHAETFVTRSCADSPPFRRRPAAELPSADQETGARSEESDRLNILYLFSGVERSDSVAAFAESVGKRLGVRVSVEAYDIMNGPHQDLADDLIFKSLVSRLHLFHSIFLSPPCSSFGCRRNDGGPRPLRGISPTDIYGFRNLDVKSAERVRMGTLLAIRSAEIVKRAIQLNIPWLLEQPAPHEHRPHMFKLPEFRELVNHNITHLDQCMVGCEFSKPTVLLGCVGVSCAAKCNHTKRWFREVPSGKWRFSAHPPLRGKLKAVPAEEWENRFFSLRESSDLPFLTAATASYPREFNEALAVALVKAAIECKTIRFKRLAEQAVHSRPAKRVHRTASEWGVGSQEIVWSAPLRGAGAVPHSLRRQEDEDAAGGLRHPERAVRRGFTGDSFAVRDLISEFLSRRPELIRQCLDHIGSDSGELPLSEVHLHEIRNSLASLFGCELSDPKNSELPTPVLISLLEAWVKHTGDGDEFVCSWLREGAPAGLSRNVPTCGVFPPNSEEPSGAPDITDPEEFVNYAGIDQDESAWEEIQGLLSKDRVAEFGSYEAVVEYLECRPTLSRVGIIEKFTAGKVKRRVIVDSKASGVSSGARKSERIVLPRLLDVINDSLYQLGHANQLGSSTELFVLDFSDAFFIVPLHPEERRHFVIRLRGRYFVFKVQAQGAAASPLVWGRLAALVMRLTQSMFHPTEMLLQCFVDDPIACVSGTRECRELNLATLIVSWLALGFPLSFKKGQVGPVVTWIGATLRISSEGVVASIKDSIIQDLTKQVEEALSGNVISRKALQSLAGRANHVASLLHVWRPFLQQLWAALSAPAGAAPNRCVWVKQISVALRWLNVFLNGTSGVLTRSFSLESYMNWGPKFELTLDASPWGLGGILVIDGRVHSYFSSELSPFDFELFGFSKGSPDGQQCWESLCALVALRLFKPFWINKRIQLAVRGDSVAMLTLILKLRPPAQSASLGIISRELALDISEAAYAPDVGVHVPGVANKGADILSREFSPDKAELPQMLRSAKRVAVPERDRQYFRTLSPATA